MKNDVILGIDPGTKGGIAIFRPNIGEVYDVISVFDIPIVDKEVDAEAVAKIIIAARPTIAFIEKVHAGPGQGGSAMFRFGNAYGTLRTVVVMCNIPYYLIPAQRWKKHFHLTPDKEKSRALAMRLWPNRDLFTRKMDHGRAEAALIACYGYEAVMKH